MLEKKIFLELKNVYIFLIDKEYPQLFYIIMPIYLIHFNIYCSSVTNYYVDKDL